MTLGFLSEPRKASREFFFFLIYSPREFFLKHFFLFLTRYLLSL